MVKYTLRLLLRTGQCSEGNHRHARRYIHLGLEGFADLQSCLFKVHSALSLNRDQDHIFIDLIIMGNVDIILTLYAVDLSEQLFHLAREHIHAVYLEHVIASTADDVQSRMFRSAGAFAGDDA